MAWLDGTTTPRTAQALEAALRAIVNANATSALTVTQSANASASTSTGGAVNVNNTGSTGAGVVVYSAQASPSGRLIVARADNPTFAQTAMYAENAGTGHALHAANTFVGTNATGSAGNFTSTNPGASCVQIGGVETARGSLKVTHTGDTAVADDVNGSALSLDIKSSGLSGATNAQGLFIDATTGGTQGKLLNLRNNGNLIFTLRGAKNADRTGGDGLVFPIVELGAGAVQITAGTGDPNTVVTAPKGSLYLRTDGGAATSLYIKETAGGNTGWAAK